MTKEEYKRLVKVAKQNGKERLCLLLQTICATDIRVSELKYITMEAVRRGELTISLKGKIRRIFIVRKLQRKLLSYARKQKITKGEIFITRQKTSLGRSNIWREFKKLSLKAKVQASKVFPHNLRNLFARSFYEMEKDIVKLADLLGHSSVNTTRIYTVGTGEEHLRCLEKLKLII